MTLLYSYLLEDKGTIMKKKSALQNKDQYKDIHIDSHKSYEQRKLDSKIRALVNAVRKDKLYMKGNNIKYVQATADGGDRNGGLGDLAA